MPTMIYQEYLAIFLHVKPNHEISVYCIVIVIIYSSIYASQDLFVCKYFKEFILSSFVIYVNSFCPHAERESVGTSYTLVIVQYDIDKDYCDIIYLMYFYFPSYCM